MTNKELADSITESIILEFHDFDPYLAQELESMKDEVQDKLFAALSHKIETILNGNLK